MLANLISDLIEGVETFLSSLMISIMEMVFHAENSMHVGFLGVNDAYTNFNFGPLFNLFRNVGIALVTIKFLKKGFDIYIGWVDGDKDNDASHLILNYIRAILTIIAFTFLYTFLVNVVETLLAESLSMLVQVTLPQGLGDIIPGAIMLVVASIVTSGAPLLVFSVFALIVLIVLLILFFRLTVVGLHMLVMRLGWPLACTGLIDSDKGVFKAFAQKFMMISLSAFTQILFFRLSLLLLTNGNILWSLVAAMAALKTPDLLREFMLAYGGAGGGVAKGMAMQGGFAMVKSFFLRR